MQRLKKSIHGLFRLCLMLGMIAQGLVQAAPVEKLLIIGDSISKHGPAVEALGWSGNWGMAASSEEKDYVHLFLARLAQEQGGKVPELLVIAEGGGTLQGKLTVKDKFRAFGADLAVIQMGENDNKDVNETGFKAPYETIIQEIKAGNPNVRLLCFGVWSPPNGSAVKDAMIRDLCKKYGATFVSLAAANANPDNMAESEKRFTHKGVNWHPGDKGMQAYADALWLGYTKPEEAEKIAAAAPVSTIVSGEVLFTEKWDGASGLVWKPEAKVETVGGAKALKIVSTGAGIFSCVTTLPVEKIKGHKLLIKTRLKGEGITAKPKPWNGVKVMLQLQNAEAKMDYPQAPVPDGSFDWTPVSWVVRIPDNIISSKLVLGLEKVDGTLFVGELEISVQP